jgi:hypothetical protein
MGGDWAYENTQFNFRNMELMLSYIKNNYKDLNMDFKLSTPSEYVKALKSKNQV